MLTAACVDAEEGFKGLRAEWNDLASRSKATIFQSWEWCWGWWQQYAKGRGLFIICIKDESALVGLAPLFVSPYFGLPIKVARFLGNGCSDYGGLVIDKGMEQDVLAAFFDFLARDRRWDALDLQQLPPSAPELAAPTSHAIASSSTLLPQEECFALDLPSDFEEYLKTISKKFRWNIGYYRRRLKREGDFAFYRASSPEEIDKDVNDFFALHRKRFLSKKRIGRFLSPRFVRFHSALSRELLKSGNLGLYFLEIDGARIAALYGFEFAGAFYYYLAGSDPEWGRFSASTVLLSMVVEDCINRGISRFDFLRGAEPYKLKWGARPVVNSRLILERPSQRSMLVSRLMRVENALVAKAKAKLAET